LATEIVLAESSIFGAMVLARMQLAYLTLAGMTLARMTLACMHAYLPALSAAGTIQGKERQDTGVGRACSI
jgi:hypothetical protein